MTGSPTTILTSASTQTSSYVSTSPSKRKRKPAGTPDPDAEVVALSPKTLMESDKYVCEFCNQGFQRDQNLQMHRRRHKVPWKLLKRVDPEVRKRVYVCPESSCLHHNPCHALGDLVGIKKHYRRKHSSMKQWECDKCSKAYAVQSDYKAHVKTCGTRGHCCDCGRVFSRVESFIEHQDTCTAARNKRDVASISDEQATSLPSLAAAPPHPNHATLMPTNSSSAAGEKTLKKDTFLHSAGFKHLPLSALTHNQEYGESTLRLLPYLESPASPAVSNPLTCLPLVTAPPSPATPSFLLPMSLPRQAPAPASASSPPDAPASTKWVSWESQQPNALVDTTNSLHTHYNAELQLLPTKPYSSQLESSQSSNVYTWGKDITSTNSTNSATICSSPSKKTTNHEKRALNITTSALPSAAPCKLQLSIGLLQDNHHLECNEDSRQPRSPCTLADKQGTIYHCKDDAIRLELATGATSGAWPSIDYYHDLRSLEKQKKQDYDYLSCKKASASEDVAVHYGDLQASKERRKSVDSDEKSPLGSWKSSSGKLLHWNSSGGMRVAVIETGSDHQQQPQREGDQPNLLSRTNVAEPRQAHIQSNYFVLKDERVQPQLAAELHLQRAREKLKRASDEVLQAEKAWREAKREREQAEAEVAGARRLASGDNVRMGIASPLIEATHEEEVEETRKFTDKNSSSSCQVSTSAASLQMPMNAGGVIITSAPSFITCPSCHQTQILYHPANLRGTFFLPSQELPSPPPPRPSQHFD